jgi:hypothetical protein
VAVSAHSLFVRCVSSKFWVAVECCSSSGDYLEPMNGHGIKKKLTINGKVKIIQEVEKNPTVLKNEIVKHFVLSP